ncbi:hypothetical protein GEMRC1_014138 [Eukaryota sp. GEM-RC1]
MTVLGIDLGTTTSCAYKCEQDRVPRHVDMLGTRTIPSLVGYSDGMMYICHSAEFLQEEDHRGVAREFKRLMGRSYSIDDAQMYREKFPYHIEKSAAGDGCCVVLNGKHFTPQELSSFILKRIKDRAECITMTEIDDAVITVPAYFTSIIAGLKFVRVLEEPVAAAIAYLHDNPELNKEGNIFLVFDLGGGSFDISLIRMKENTHTVLATDGDTELCGTDFDELLFQYCLDEAEEQFGPEILHNGHFISTLRCKCEKAKVMLDSEECVEIRFMTPGFRDEYSTIISRSDFEQMCAEKFNQCMQRVDNLLKRTELTAGVVQSVLLVGGSTRIPKIQQMLREKFGNSKVVLHTKVDEVVAKGACLMLTSPSIRLRVSD